MNGTTPRVTPRLGVHVSNHGSAQTGLALAQLADQEGLDSVWISEDLYFRGAVPIAGAIAATTTSVNIGFGVLTPYNRHVSLMAMEIAALIDIAGPRVIAGVGAGVAARTQAMDVTYANPLATVREVVELLKALLAGESITNQGPTQRARQLQLSFPDLPAMPPIYVAAVGPKALQQAGRIADGVVLSLMSSRKYIAWAAAQTAIGTSAAGRPVLPIVAYVPLAVADTTREAIAALKPVIGYYIRRWAPIESLQLLFTDWGPITRDELLVMAQQLDDGQEPASVVPDDLILEYCIAGDIDECRRQIRGLAIAGVTDIIVDPSGSAEHKQSEVRALAHLRNIIQKEGL